jgi:predicted nucleotidyltransferase
VNDWPGAANVRASRQWPTLEGIVRRAREIDAIDGVIAIGSVATGDLDELSDVDVLAVVAPGAFEAVWAERHRLAGELLVTWRPRSQPRPQLEWMNWLTRDLVKVECGVVDPAAGGKALAEPFAVLLGDPSLADRFPRISLAVVKERRAALQEQQRDFDRDELTGGELIDWKLWELKHAVRALRDGAG